MATERMRRRSEFLAARRGRRLNGPLFFIEALDRKDAGEARFGLTVTRKVGNSVERNRIRRRLREAIRTVCGPDMVAGFDYVIVARRDLLDVPFAELTNELSRRFLRTLPKAARHGADDRPSGQPAGMD